MFAAAAPSFLSRALQLISGVRRAQEPLLGSEDDGREQRNAARFGEWIARR